MTIFEIIATLNLLASVYLYIINKCDRACYHMLMVILMMIINQ